MDSVTAGTAAASKALVLDSNKDIGTIRNLTIDGTFSDGNYTFDTSGNVSGLGTVGCGAITSSGNLAVTGTLTGDTSLTLDSTTITTTEIGVLDGVTAGVAAASKALVLDSNKDIGTIRNLTIDGNFGLTADTSIITFGANQDVYLTHLHNSGLMIENKITNDNNPVTLRLRSRESTIVSNEVIGCIEFSSSDISGGDAASNCACICAISESSFTSSSNATKLVFTTGVSEDASLVTNASATQKMILSSAGALSLVGDITALTSDKRLKKNIEIIENPLEKVNKLSGFTYDWNIDICEEAGFIPKDERQIGVFAQDVQSVIPEAVKPAPFDTKDGVSKSGDNYLTVQYEKIVPLLIESLKEQQNMIEDLQGQINELKK